MAWPAVLPTFTGAMTAGVAAACQKLSDALATLAGARTTYVPTWGAATVNPTLGNGTVAGRWRKVDREVKGSIQITMGSTTTYGTGAWSITLPTAALLSSLVFEGTARDTSAGTSFPVYGELVPGSTTVLTLRVLNSTAGGPYLSVDSSGARPLPWASTDVLTLDFEYETP